MRKGMKKVMLMALVLVIFLGMPYHHASAAKSVTESEVSSQLNSFMKQYVGSKWTGSYMNAIQCKGFATMIFDKIFDLGGKTIGTGSTINNSTNWKLNNLNSTVDCLGTVYNAAESDYANLLKQAKPGDFLQTRRRSSGNPHSMIVVSVSDSQIEIFDCNSEGDLLVRHYYQNFSAFKSRNIGVSLYRSKHYNVNASITPTKPTGTASTSGSNVALTWGACSGATYYWLDVYVDGAASSFLSKSIGNVTSYTITDLSPGNYTAFLTAANSTKGITSDGIHFRIGVDAVDVGTDFYAYIINTPSWKHLTNDGDNVSVRTSGMILDKQVWKFERQSDLSYIIRSCVDTNKVLGVDGSNGNVLAKVSNTDLGKWYISGVSADYRFTNKQTFQVLDLAGGETADGTNVQQWESNGTNAQKFQIWKIPKPAATTLKVTAGTSEKETIFSWVSEVNTRNYNLKIYNGTVWESAETMSQWNMTGTSCSVKLPAGYYEAYIDTVNQAGFAMSNVVKFTVQASSYTISYNANGGTGAPGNQTKVYDQPMKIDGTKPTRPGYTFLGWSTSSTATSATYQPNGTYTANSGATLYAVWKSDLVNLGDDFYANIVLDVNKNKLSVSGYNVVAKGNDGSDGQVWYFKRLSDGGYNIMNCADGRMLDVLNANDANGTNVQTHPSNGNAAQVWYVYDNGSGTYYLRPKCSEIRVLDVNLGDGNAQIWEGECYASHDPQRFTINKVEKPKYIISYNANGGDVAPSSQTKEYNTTLILSNTKPSRNGYDFLGWSTSSTATSATYQPNGTYTANSGATLYAVWKADFVDLGTWDYPAVPDKAKGCLFVRICYSGTNMYLTNRNTDSNSKDYQNVDLQPSNDTYNQVWEMVRLSDGSYKIVSLFDQRVLDIHNNKREDKTNVGVYPWLDNTAQKWYIYQENGKYVLKPINSVDYCLGVAGATQDSNVQLSDNSTSQKYFNIEILDQPGKSTLKVEKVGSRSVPTKISWTPADKATWYNLYFYDGECWKSNCIKSVLRINGTTCEVQLEPGTYQMHLSPHNYYPWTNSNVVEFTVAEDTYTISYSSNGGSGAPDAQIKEYNLALTLSNTKPIRSGYDFLGWSTSSTATSATYQPGGRYTDNSNVSLYAVWKKNSSAISGNVTSYDIHKSDTVTIRLLDSAGTSEIKKVQCTAGASSQVAYEIKDVQAGNYILEVSKEGHVTRTYDITVSDEPMTQDVKICLVGDVTGDGKVNTRDLNRVYAHVNGTNPLAGYEFDCGDVTGDGKINTRDLNRLYAHISEINPLW